MDPQPTTDDSPDDGNRLMDGSRNPDGVRRARHVEPSDLEFIPIDPDLEADDPGEPSRGRPRGHGGQTRRTHPAVLASISIGGMLGATARHGVSQVIHASPDSFPWATFTANISGSFLLGFILVLLIDRFPPSHYLRVFVATGFLGAYTTMSTFQVETVTLIKDGDTVLGVVYSLATIAVGLTAAWLGISAGRSSSTHLPTPPPQRRAGATNGTSVSRARSGESTRSHSRQATPTSTTRTQR